MGVFFGTILVLTTWVVSTLLISGLGLVITSQGSSRVHVTLRRSLWWGLGLTLVYVLAVSLALPLGNLVGSVVFITFCFGSGVIGWSRLRARPSGISLKRVRGRLWVTAPVLLGLVYIAVAALGPVTNYDTGLYHLGALRYQQEFGLVPGIANLYFPFGYSSSLVSLGAFLGASPWDENAFRLVNGLLLTLLAVEMLLRFLTRRWSPGTYLLLGSMVFLWVPLVALSDYWVTSPTSDSSILVVVTVSATYLADALWRRSGSDARWSDASVALVLAFVAVSMRPTMASFALGVLVVLIGIGMREALVRRDSGWVYARFSMVFAALLGVAIAIAQIARDRVLSGWLQYPLSVLAFDVPWKAPDPIWVRTATLGAGRDPSDLWNAASSWEWVPGWAGRALTQWEFWMALLLLIVSAVLAVIAKRTSGHAQIGIVMASCFPSAIAVVAWFLASPPYFRFIWGPLFTLAALPGAWSAYVISKSARQVNVRYTMRVIPRLLSAATAAGLSVVIVFSAVTRLSINSINTPARWSLGPLSLHYAIADVQVPLTTQSTLESGLVIISPVESDQCWAAYPLCTPRIEPTVSLRGPSVSEGFLP